MSGRSEVTPAPLQPHGLASYVHLPLNPNPPISAIERNMMSAFGHHAQHGDQVEGPRTQPHTPQESSFVRYPNPIARLSWPNLVDPLDGRWGEPAARGGQEREPEPEHEDNPNAQAAMAEDDDDGDLRGEDLAAAEAEVAGRFEIDLLSARAVLHSLQGALQQSWEALEETSKERQDRQRHLSRARKHVAKLYELNPLVRDSELATVHLTEARTALEGLEKVASVALEDADVELQQWKRHVRVLQGLLVPLASEPGGRHRPLCSVCMARPVSRVLLPCGHTLCQRCSERRQSTRSQCYTCRGHVAESRLFYV